MSDDERHEHNFEQVSRYSLGCCLCTIVLFSVWPFFRLGLWHRAFAEIIGKQVRKTTSRRETKTCICGWSRKRVDLSLWRFLQTRWEMLLLRLVLHPSLLPASSCFARILEYHFARLFAYSGLLAFRSSYCHKERSPLLSTLPPFLPFPLPDLVDPLSSYFCPSSPHLPHLLFL